ncbi:MAG TPA: transketolase [Candidatus Nanoarchaeia archaeon]|nr:transketolase [Candidatus Nanoarchaeia archaeon]
MNYSTAQWQQKAKEIPLDAESIRLRRLIIRTLQCGNRGHGPTAISCIEMLRVLYNDIMKYNPKDPAWSERDRFILSKGHGCIAQYVMLAEKGFFPKAELWKFCKSGALLGGHPEHKIPGVELSTGSLGHGLPVGVGFALNAKIDSAAYRTFVVIGDGESGEGSVWEAALYAAKHKLDNLIVLVDYNKQLTYSTTFEVLDLEPLADKWRSFGFAVKEINGHDIHELKSTLLNIPLEKNKPTAIICHTVKGKGIPMLEGNFAWHHKSSIAEEDFAKLYEPLGGPWRDE